MTKILNLCGFSLLLAACSEAPDQIMARTCAPISSDAVILLIRDARTAQPAATGSVSSALFTTIGGVQTAITGSNNPDGLSVRLGGQVGTYDITVKKAGFGERAFLGVLVQEDPQIACAPKPDTLLVQLSATQP